LINQTAYLISIVWRVSIGRR